MQHDHVLKKVEFRPFDPQGCGECMCVCVCVCVGGGGGVGICGQNICYHVSAYVIPFNLICNMNKF